MSLVVSPIPTEPPLALVQQDRAPMFEAQLHFHAKSEALSKCFGLRYQYFVQERGWVAEESCSHGEEEDRYDPHALHISVWEKSDVVGYLRALPFDPVVGFMLDRELSAILSSDERNALQREATVELSRLVCHLVHRRTRIRGIHPLEFLLKRLYQESLKRGFQRFYIVVEADWLVPFARRFGLHFQVIGKPYTFPDGTQTVAATATIGELEASMRQHSEAKYLWYRDGRDES